MHKLLTAAFCFFAASVFGATPSFQSFNPDQFNTSGNKVAAKSGILLTNPIVNAGTITGSGLGLTNTPMPEGNNVLVIDNKDGNDAFAVTNPYTVSWRTAYDLWNTNGWVQRGALSVAKPGDTIYFKPSSNTYYVPALPLNLWGSNVNGAHLVVPAGVMIIRTNFSNTNATGFEPAYSGSVGPLIMPGNNSKVVIDGTVITTNFPGGTGLDSAVGWLGTLVTGGRLTNNAATNVYVGGSGWLYGNGDCVIFQSSFWGSGELENLHIRSRYDAGNNVNFNHITRNLDVVVTSQDNNTESRGWVVWDGQYADYGSRFEATAGTNNALVVAGIDIQNTTQSNTISLNGTTLIVRTNANGATGSSTPLKFGTQSGTASGSWIERTHTNSLLMSTALSQMTTAFTADTNQVTLVGAGTSGANGTYTWLVNRYTNSTPSISNDAVGIIYVRAAAGLAIRYFSTNGYLGPYWTTNTGADPPPTAFHPTNTFITRSTVTTNNQSRLISTNFISGWMYSNMYGAVIEVSGNVFRVETPSGPAAMHIRVAGWKTNASASIGDQTSLSTNYLAMKVPIGSTYTWTNVSTGAGTSAQIFDGTLLVLP